MDHLVAQLNRLRESQTLTPDLVWKERATKTLTAHMRASAPQMAVRVSYVDKVAQAVHILLPRTVAGAVRPVFTAFMVSVMAVSGWIATVSASYSVPGDTLYGVKIAAEKTQVAVAAATGSDSWETELHLRFASERARETKDVVAKNPAHASEQATVAIASLKESLQAVNEKIDALTVAGDSDSAAALAKDVNQKTNQIVATLGEVSKDPNTVETSVVKEVVETTRLVNDTGIKAIAAAIQKQSEDDTTTDDAKQEMKNLVVEKINALSVDPVVTGNVPDIAPVVTTTLTNTIHQVQSDIQKADVTSSTIQSVQKAVDTVQQVVQKVEQTAQGTATAKGAIEQAKSFADNNQLTEAIQKVKEANAAAQDVKQAVVEVHEAVKDILPVVEPVNPGSSGPTAAAAVGNLLSVVTNTPAFPLMTDLKMLPISTKNTTSTTSTVMTGSSGGGGVGSSVVHTN